jgi:excisionase family DNA binding protein
VTLLTAKETAAQLKISMSTLRNWRKEGKGPRVIKLGPGTYRYSEEELREYVESKIGQEQKA